MSHDYPACAMFRGGLCTCDTADDLRANAVRSLREGEVMMVYLEFDRRADKSWSAAEYLLWFGVAVSAATVAANAKPPADAQIVGA